MQHNKVTLYTHQWEFITFDTAVLANANTKLI